MAASATAPEGNPITVGCLFSVYLVKPLPVDKEEEIAQK